MVGVSLHIGLNFFDAGHYGNNGKLRGAVYDAEAMRAIASSQGYTSTILLNEEATSGVIARHIAETSVQLSAGDIFLITYAGHGAQLFDRQGDEEDSLDETWCLFDRMLLDDELFNLFGLYKSGVRIFMISDSCHSGTMARAKKYDSLGTDDDEFVFRVLPSEISEAVWKDHQSLYDAAKYTSFRGEASPLSASVELFSGCQDNQLSQDGPTNGYFTAQLLKIWDSGSFAGTHPNFFTQIKALMPPWQTPNRMSLGPQNQKFEKNAPFKI